MTDPPPALLTREHADRTDGPGRHRMSRTRLSTAGAWQSQSRLRRPVSTARTTVVSTHPAMIDAHTHQRTHPVATQAVS